jgi:hypothetical protein
MLGKIAALGFATLIALSPFVFGNPATALAQYQVQYQVNLAPPAPMRQLSQAPVATEPFGLPVEPVTYGEMLSKWSGVVAEIGAESDILDRCRNDASFCPAAAQKIPRRCSGRPRP